MTFQKYDEMIEDFGNYTSPAYYPSIEEIDKMQENPDSWIRFACYCYEFGEKPKTKEEQYRRKTLRMFIDEHLELS